MKVYSMIDVAIIAKLLAIIMCLQLISKIEFARSFYVSLRIQFNITYITDICMHCMWLNS